MGGREIERVRAKSALQVIRQHPILVLFALTPVLAAVGTICWLAGTGWAVCAALLLLLGGATLTVLKS
ncbi:hypothetical protein [Mycobacterium sp.]|uniref:hypothetical protein n=1 Tax=Mycobacterium sp. TaxID=1785 RepID=UPI003BA9E5DD